MKDLATVIKNRDGGALATMASGDVSQRRVVNADAQQLVDVLFDNLVPIFPAARHTVMADPSAEAATKRQWILAFAENGITTVEQVRAGMRIARQQETDFWPSCGKFIAWCRDGMVSAVGLPAAADIFDEFKRYAAERGRYQSPETYPWPHPVMYWIVLDVRRLMQQYNYTDVEVMKSIKSKLAVWARDIAKGKTIPNPVARIADNRRPKTAAELAGNPEYYKSIGLAALASIRQQIRVNTSRGSA
ncbi:replication protein P [Edwardsiella tarda]|uniref:replication protein P n=1 Tax=Edwardsiella tarda TaxID=636 RepID=UPI00351C74CA